MAEDVGSVYAQVRLRTDRAEQDLRQFGGRAGPAMSTAVDRAIQSGARAGTTAAARMFGSGFAPATTQAGRLLEQSLERAGRDGGRHAAAGLRTGLSGLAGSLGGVLGLGAGVAALGGIIDAAQGAQLQMARTRNVIETTGAAAGVTADQVKDLADSIEAKTSADADAVQSGANLLLTFTNIRNGVGDGNQIFDRATETITDMAAAMADGEVTADGLKGASVQLGKALNDPIKGVSALAKVGVSFTEQQREQIRVLVESGQTMEAQKIILDELGKEFGGAAKAAQTPLKQLQVTVGALQEELGNAVLPAVNAAATGVSHFVTAFGAVPATLLAAAVPLARFAGPALGSLTAGLAGSAGGFRIAAAAQAEAARATAAHTALVSQYARAAGPVPALVGAQATALAGQAAQARAAAAGVTGLSGAAGRAVGQVRAADGALATFTAGMRGAATVAGVGFRGALSGVVGFLGGPWGAAITAATIGVSLFLSQQQKAKASADATKASLEGLAGVFKDGVTPDSIAAADGLLRQDKNLRGLLETTRAAGVATESLVKGLNGDRAARDQVIQAIQYQIDVEQARLSAIKDGAAGDGEASLRRVRSLTEQRVAFAKANTAAAESTLITRALGDEQRALSASTRTTTIDVDELSTGFAVLDEKMAEQNDTALTSKDIAAALRDQYEQLHGTVVGNIEASESYASATVNLSKAVDDNTRKVDLSSAGSLKNRDAIEAAVTANQNLYYANIASGESIDTATGKYRANQTALENQLVKLGFNKDAVHALVQEYGGIPTSKSTEIIVSGAEKAYQQLKDLRVAQYAIDNNVSLDSARRTFEDQEVNRNLRNARGYASGGKVVGPGTPTSDSVLARLSRDEHVLTAEEVRAAGGHAAVEEWRRSLTGPGPKPGGLATYRAGGPVEINAPALLEDFVNAHRIAVPDTGPWPGSPGAQRGDSGVWRSIVALIRSTGPLSGAFGNSYRPGDPLWHGCMDLGTQVLTRRGWVSHDQIEIGVDETIGYNPATGRSEWTPIVGVYRYDDAPLFNIGHQRWSVEATAGHRWITEAGMRTTDELRQRDTLIVAAPLDGQKAPCTEHEAELLGFLLADGNVKHGIRFTFRRGRKISYARRLLADVPHSVNQQRDGQTVFYVMADYANELLDRTGFTKSDPERFVRTLGSDLSAAFLRGVEAGDGCVQKGRRTRTTQLQGRRADAITLAMFLAGGRPNRVRYTPTERAGKVDLPLEQISVHGPTLPFKNMGRGHSRNAPVWCPTTVLGTWTARQGRHIFLTGNSGRAVDWMGYNQDALASFLAARRPLELIHRTATRDYAYTRGVNKGSFSESLMEAHRNHIHIAMNGGGRVRGPAGRDAVPSRLTADEYVIRAPATRRLGTDVLDALNRADEWPRTPRGGGAPTMVELGPSTIKALAQALRLRATLDGQVVATAVDHRAGFAIDTGGM